MYQAEEGGTVTVSSGLSGPGDETAPAVSSLPLMTCAKTNVKDVMIH